MKSFLNKNRSLLLILLLATSLRLINLEKLTTFSADQGRDMLLVYHLIQQRQFTLLGPPSSQGDFFFGPIYYYLIAPGLIISNFNPLGAVLIVILIDLIGLICLFYLVKSFFSPTTAIAAASIYATAPILIHWSQTAFNPFLIPGFASMVLFALAKSYQTKNPDWLLLAGFLSGILIQLHYAAAPMALIVLIFALIKRVSPLYFFITLGTTLLGLSPLIGFELRHDFFNTQAITKFIQSSLSASASPQFTLHYLAVFTPFIFLLLAWLWQHLHRFNRHLAALVILAALIFNLSQLNLNAPQGHTMPQNWNLPHARVTASLIAQDVKTNQPDSFNIASTLDGDSRAQPLRYLLEAQFRTIPKGVEQYPSSQVLYVVSRWNQEEVLNRPLWEISSFAPKRSSQTWPITNDIKLYKLEKI